MNNIQNMFNKEEKIKGSFYRTKVIRDCHTLEIPLLGSPNHKTYKEPETLVCLKNVRFRSEKSL